MTRGLRWTLLAGDLKGYPDQSRCLFRFSPSDESDLTGSRGWLPAMSIHGDNDTTFCQRAEDGLRVVISKTLRTSANGIRQMPAGSVPKKPWTAMTSAAGVRGQM